MSKKQNIIISVLIISILILTYLIYSDFFSFFVCDHLQFSIDSSNHFGQIGQCYRELGREKQDINFCNKIDKIISQLSMRDYCILGVAESTKDYKVCEESGDRDRCLYLLITDGIVKDPSLCDTMSNSPISFQDSCFSDLGADLNNDSLCAKINHLGQKNLCFFRVAQNTKNSSICKKIVVENPGVGDYRTYCLNELQ